MDRDSMCSLGMLGETEGLQPGDGWRWAHRVKETEKGDLT